MWFWIYTISDCVIVLIGIKLSYESFKVFRAERLGFPMEGEFENTESLADNEEYDEGDDEENAKSASGSGGEDSD